MCTPLHPSLYIRIRGIPLTGEENMNFLIIFSNMDYYVGAHLKIDHYRYLTCENMIKLLVN